MTPVEKYFLGEKLQCTIGIALAVMSLVVAFYFLLLVRTDFYKGISYPFIVVAVLLIAICAGIIWRTPRDIERVSAYVMREPAKIKTEEIPRMEKVMRNFRTIKIVEICLIVVGVSLFVLLPQGSGLARGVGLGLAIQGLIMFGFDQFAETRGKAYFEYLNNL